MPTYYVNEAAFTLPERRFVDRTLHRLESPLPGEPGGEPLTLIVRRLPLEEGKSLRQLVDGEIAATAEKSKSFAVIGEAEITLAGAPAILLRARYRAGDVAHYQQQAHVAFEGTWIALVVSGPYPERAACEEAFDRVVHTLEWRSA